MVEQLKLFKIKGLNKYIIIEIFSYVPSNGMMVTSDYYRQLNRETRSMFLGGSYSFLIR